MSEAPDFHIGQDVEIQSSDFHFLPAIVIGAAPKNTQIIVQFRTPEAKSRKAVEKAALRPKQPLEIGRKFGFGDLVDGFFNGGWREGVITEVLEDKKGFVVFLKNSKEQREFQASEIRVHREWIKGSWIPPLPKELVPPPDEEYLTTPAVLVKKPRKEEKPSLRDVIQEDMPPNPGKELLTAPAAFVKEPRIGEKPSLRDMIQEDVLPNPKKEMNTASIPSSKNEREKKEFRKGELVEVRTDEDGFQGAWFTASIMGTVGNDKFLVEYQDLRNDEDTGNLKEEIDAKDIRPHPPEAIVVDGYSLNEEVDALYNDGWWQGKISKVLCGARYKVYFEGTDEELVFDHSELRPHQDWINNTWL